MRISINGKGMEVSDYLRDVIVKRVDKLDKYFRQDTEAMPSPSARRMISPAR